LFSDRRLTFVRFDLGYTLAHCLDSFCFQSFIPADHKLFKPQKVISQQQLIKYLFVLGSKSFFE
jgi:hypothetical protein